MAASTLPTLTPEPALQPAEIKFGGAAEARLAGLNSGRQAYWQGVLRHGSKICAPNLRTRPGIVCHEDRWWPLTINDRREGNSYPCSLHTQYVTYPQAELSLVPGLAQRRVARIGLLALDLILRIAQADRVAQWSSWLFSTNLHEPGMGSSVEAVTRTLVSAFPDHAVLVKNVHGFEEPSLPGAFEAAGYDLVTSRQIYFFDGRTRDYLQKSTVKRDLKSLAQLVDYQVVEHNQIQPQDLPRITDLYRQLYLEKHSWLNPQYSEVFVARAWREGWLEFRGLRHASGRLDGIFACFTSGQTTSTPFIGYDTTLPSELGLYRHLVSMLLQRLAERRWLLNYSSGAGDFKRRRGGQPVIEFNAIYHRHLPARRRAAFSILATLANRWGRQFLEENEI